MKFERDFNILQHLFNLNFENGNFVLDPNFEFWWREINNIIRNKTNFKNAQDKLKEADKIWNDKFKWVDPIGPHCWKNLEDMYWWLDAGDTEKWCDPHPSLNLSIDWLYNKLKPAPTERKSLEGGKSGVMEGR